MGEQQTPEKPRSEGAATEDVAPRGADDTMRWVRRGSLLLVLLIGWLFILVTNHFRITPPVVFVCLGYFAAVCAIYTLYRTGATAVTETDEADDAMSWDKPLGALDELEREKRALLKAIKEAEFDHQMGKLSKSDADNMINIYRTRAIVVIKEIEVQQAAGETGTVRDRILREARARIEIETKSKAEVPAAAKKKKKGDDKQKARADKLAEAVSAAKADKPDVPASDTTPSDAEQRTRNGDEVAVDNSTEFDRNAVDDSDEIEKPVDPDEAKATEAKASEDPVPVPVAPPSEASGSKEAAR